MFFAEIDGYPDRVLAVVDVKKSFCCVLRIARGKSTMGDGHEAPEEKSRQVSFWILMASVAGSILCFYLCCAKIYACREPWDYPPSRIFNARVLITIYWACSVAISASTLVWRSRPINRASFDGIIGRSLVSLVLLVHATLLVICWFTFILLGTSGWVSTVSP